MSRVSRQTHCPCRRVPKDCQIKSKRRLAPARPNGQQSPNSRRQSRRVPKDGQNNGECYLTTADPIRQPAPRRSGRPMDVQTLTDYSPSCNARASSDNPFSPIASPIASPVAFGGPFLRFLPPRGRFFFFGSVIVSPSSSPPS